VEIKTLGRKEGSVHTEPGESFTRRLFIVYDSVELKPHYVPIASLCFFDLMVLLSRIRSRVIHIHQAFGHTCSYT